MRRYALLIEASEARGQKKILGCLRDVERLEAWLGHEYGGAWDVRKEVKVLHNPTAMDIAIAKGLADVADFAVVSFSGHGRIVEDEFRRKTQMITLGDGREVPFDSIRPTAPKSIIVCDACREIHRPIRYARVMTKAAAIFEAFSEQYSRAQFRAVYEDAIEKGPRESFTMYSCSPGQCAGDDPLVGGTFTDALLVAALEWCKDVSESSWLHVDGAFDLARQAVSAKTAGSEDPQDPVCAPSTRSSAFARNPFPFAVCLK